MATAVASSQHPYFEEIGRLFYNYRLAQFNRRYYGVLFDRAKRKNLTVQLVISFCTVLAFAALSLAPSSELLKPFEGWFILAAALLSAVAFIFSVCASVFGWNQTIDEITARIHAWHYAERQLESGLRFLHHSALSKREADLQVQFAEEAYRTADNLPETGKQDMELTKTIRLEVEKAIPPDYVWTAL